MAVEVTLEFDIPDMQAGLPVGDGSIIRTRIEGDDWETRVIRYPRHDGAFLGYQEPPVLLTLEGERWDGIA